mmetsp:Transcript_9758/g.23257  ORF Transcript_9758/g.23257 Transcript_9758/m.23257 type:complete len:116 (+) Transcript_9758:442-789(+)
MCCAVVCKGAADICSDQGAEPVICDDVGSLKRPGGLGDFLAGTLATLWLHHHRDAKVDPCLVCSAACAVVRLASLRACEVKRRSLCAVDVADFLAGAIEELCPSSKSDRLQSASY